jgi:hypothetical protein
MYKMISISVQYCRRVRLTWSSISIINTGRTGISAQVSIRSDIRDERYRIALSLILEPSIGLKRVKSDVRYQIKLFLQYTIFDIQIFYCPCSYLCPFSCYCKMNKKRNTNTNMNMNMKLNINITLFWVKIILILDYQILCRPNIVIDLNVDIV